MEYLDFSIKIEPKREGVYPISVSSPAGDARSSFQLDPDTLGTLLSNLGETVRSAGLTATRGVVRNVEAQSPENVGERLFNAVFQGAILSRLDHSLGMIAGKEQGLRIKIHINPEDQDLVQLVGLPWELFYRRETRRYLNLSKLTPVVRYLEVPIPFKKVPFQSPLRVLVAIANPSGSEQLDLSAERNQIERSLDAMEDCEVDIIEHASVQDLLDKLAEKDYHVLHYMGHGDFDERTGKGVLVMEDGENGKTLVSGQKLGMLLKDEPTMRLVFINACNTAKATQRHGLDPFSGVASALVMAGMPAVVAMQFPISDTAAIRFSRQFYKELTNGSPVDTAVAEGRKAISVAEEQTMEWATPVLFMRARDGVLFEIKKMSTPYVEAPHISPSEIEELGVQEPSHPVADAPSVAEQTVQEKVRAPLPHALNGSNEGGDWKKLALWGSLGFVGIAVAVLLLVKPFSNGEGGGEPEPTGDRAPIVRSVMLAPGASSVEEGESLAVSAVLLDTTNQSLRPTDAQRVSLVWSSSDSAIASILKNESSTNAKVQGLRPGTVTISATVSGQPMDVTPVDSRRITVVPSAISLNAAERQYMLAEQSFNRPDSTDETVVTKYKILLDDHSAAVEQSDLIDQVDVEGTIENLDAVVQLFNQTMQAEQSDTLTIIEERDAWQTYLAQADAIRRSPSSNLAATRRDSLSTLATNYATLVSLETCRVAGLDCTPRQQANTFSSGSLVYFSAKLNLPSRQWVKWEWHTPEGNRIKRDSTQISTAPGYRTYQQLRTNDLSGRFILSVFNENNNLIGRKDVLVQ